MNLKEISTMASPSNNVKMQKTKDQWNRLAKPLYGMGILEDFVTKISGINGDIDISKRCVAVMCSDNGIVEENVTQTGSEVTALIAENMTKSQASVTNMAKIANADVFVYDVGMLCEVPNVINKKVACGTKNFAKEPAMTKEEAVSIINAGIEIVKELKEKGYTLIASGEMGIGNTSTSSAMAAVLLGVPAETVTGRGAGLSKEGVSHKSRVIAKAIENLKPDSNDPIDVLAKVGGFDIAAMCGLFIGGAVYKVPIIIDGLISSISALLAYRICPFSKDYMLPSHMSAEPAAQMILAELQLCAPLNCKMALGEGTGAVSLIPILDMAIAVYKNMPTFDHLNIDEYEPL